MDPKSAKELVHFHAWLERVDEITQRGKQAYLADALLQGAGDSLMMKLGEAAHRLSPARRARARRSRGDLSVANRNFILHPARRDQPRTDLAHPLARSSGWRSSLAALFVEASATIQDDPD